MEEIWDDLSGQTLDPVKVKDTRQDDMKGIRKHTLYTKVPIKECWDITGKEPIGTRWVDINKGDEHNPEYRSRLVAQEIHNNTRDDLFAATPPLEALKLLLSTLATTKRK